jgi:hypothetical protein
MSGCVDELHPNYSGRFHGDVTTVFAGFYDVIYVRLVKITSPRNLRVIYGVNRNLGCTPIRGSPRPSRLASKIQKGYELELELIQTQMTQKPMQRAEVYARALRASQNRK